MKLRLEILVLISLLFILALPMGIYSTILEDNNITQNNTTILNVPDVRQPSNSSSGATALQAVLAYYGTDTSMESIINMTNTTENGTTPENIAQAARDSGLTAEVKENMTIKELNDNINQGIPTIVLCQAWGNNNTGNWTDVTGNGHYMVVIGMDSENIYMEDPAIFGSKGYIPLQEFLDRWHEQFLVNENGNETQNSTGNETENSTENSTENNTSTTVMRHLGIVITGGEAVTFLPFIKIG